MKLECLCVYVVFFMLTHRTRLFLVWILLSGSFYICFCVSCSFFIPIKTDTAKQEKWWKTPHNVFSCQFAQLCSQIVFLIFGWAWKIPICAGNTIARLVSAKFKTTKKWPNIVQNEKSKIGPSRSQKLVQLCCTTQLDQFFDSVFKYCLA